MRGSSPILNSRAGSAPGVGGATSCLAPRQLSWVTAGVASTVSKGSPVHTSLAKMKSVSTFEGRRTHAYVFVHVHCMPVIAKDAKKAVEKSSDHSRNCLNLEGTDSLLHTYSSGGQYTTHSLKTQAIPFPQFDAALGAFLSRFSFLWFPFLCSALTMLAP